MDETTADRLTIAATQLDITTDRIFQGGVTADDLGPVAAYLTTLTEHGYQIASLALHAIDSTDPQHPIHDTPHGTNAQSAISHQPSATQKPSSTLESTSHAKPNTTSTRCTPMTPSSEIRDPPSRRTMPHELVNLGGIVAVTNGDGCRPMTGAGEVGRHDLVRPRAGGTDVPVNSAQRTASPPGHFPYAGGSAALAMP